MKKAYDWGFLVDQLKGHGLEITEDIAKALTNELLDWLSKSADLSENDYDDILKAVIPLFKGQLMKQIDKIDGKVG